MWGDCFINGVTTKAGPNPGPGSRMSQPNVSSLSIPVQSGGVGGPAWGKTWQTGTDVALRRTVVDNILQLFLNEFQKQLGPTTPEWQQKVPDYVKRLEEALYRSAATKEEYGDQVTLESRLQTVAKRMTSANQQAPQHGSPGNMIPIPGSTMTPTPGNISVPGVVSGMMSTRGSACTMVPTPGTVSNVISIPGGIMPKPGHANSVLPSLNNMMSSSGKLNMMVASGNGRMMIAPGSTMNSMVSGSGNMISTPGTSGNPLVLQQGMRSTGMGQNGHLGTSTQTQIPSGSLSVAGAIDPQRAQQYSKQKRWLLFLRHASQCTASEGQCTVSPACDKARKLWIHIRSCHERDCQDIRCNESRSLLHHYRICTNSQCPVCGPVKQILNQKRPQSLLVQGSLATMSSAAFTMTNMGNLGPRGTLPALASTVSRSFEVDLQQPTPKRVKVGGSLNGSTALQPPQQQTISKAHPSPEVAGQQQEAPNCYHTAPTVEAQSPVKTESVGSTTVNVKMEEQAIFSSPAANTKTSASMAKSAKPKNIGISLMEHFTPEMIQEHITGLRQWVGQCKAKAAKNQAMEHQMTDNACRLCGVEKLTFEPLPTYCTGCSNLIKRNALYYIVGSGETRHRFCNPCYNGICTETVEMDGMSYLKAKLEKRKNNEEAEDSAEEDWVQCDKCKQWNHQICALFNGQRNEGGEIEYICPECCLKEIQMGERKPLPSCTVLGAKDLPKTFLSDYVEQRLAKKLKHERTERAKALGKNIKDVPGAESLVVRVVSSVDKKIEVKQHFREIFQEDYPTEFPYKSKAILLFQKIDGIEVCLFGMYVQEFGVECPHPNQRCIYLSYLDSVKYFRPDVKTASGEALRTYVYHEILIAYLDYCKRRGFSSCYIWACPPVKREDYILYCHPEIQKTPQSNQLQKWHLAMLKKATNDGIVVEVTNLYDYFFVSTGETKARVTATRMPYFDGDYWPGAAEDVIVQLQQEEEERCKLQKKGRNKKTGVKHASKSTVQAELASNASKDLQLMSKLGESMLRRKEDFIMVHMHYACTHCQLFITSGYLWSCKQCKNFQLCDSCYYTKQSWEERHQHPITHKEAHALTPIQVEVPEETEDKDELMESEFFDNRQDFLSLCQTNHYQYDTLRRAKHSSMMVLYHLHNPTAPVFVVTCNMCLHEIKAGARWRCETCPDFDLCKKCSQLSKHPHKLTPHPSASKSNAEKKEGRQHPVSQLSKTLNLLVQTSPV